MKGIQHTGRETINIDAHVVKINATGNIAYFALAGAFILAILLIITRKKHKNIRTKIKKKLRRRK